MPSLYEFIGPKPNEEHTSKLEKLGAGKPCSKCDLDSNDTYWDSVNLVMSWTCPNGHNNTFKVS